MPLTRHPANPILSRGDIPATGADLTDVSSVFNPGAALLEGRFFLLLRVQNRGRETYLMGAESDDGARFRVRPGGIPIRNLDRAGHVYHAYDPRITRLGEEWFVVLALDRDDDCRLGLATTRDFRELEFLGVVSEDDSRNGVLFPEKIRGSWAMLERPNRTRPDDGPPTGDEIVLSYSDDLRLWRRSTTVIEGRWRYWDERIGPGTPPVKTRHGWLLLYHGVATHFASANVYQVGALLLDLQDPSHVLARTRYNILEPRELYETVGQVPNVVMPCGWIVTDIDATGFARPDSPVFVYYGAADTSVCLATTTITELIEDCHA